MISEETLPQLGFTKPYAKWVGPDTISWLNQHPVTKCWSIVKGSVIQYTGINDGTDLIEKYRELTGIDLREKSLIGA